MPIPSSVAGVGAILWLVSSLIGPAAAAPKTVVTIKPVHSLVAGVMAGVGAPVLLVTGAGSPHGHALKPSQARALAAADLVIWIGPEMESFFIKPARSLPKTTVILGLLDRDELKRLPARRGGAWEGHDHDDGDYENAGGDGDTDPHAWLDPANGRAIVALVAATLSRMDPENAAAYRTNADRMVRKLIALDQEIAGLLAPVREVPYVVFHDAYQYFEARFTTRAMGAISLAPDRRPSARRLVEIRRRIKDTGAVCVFTEPQFTPRLVETAREGTSARVAMLDPLGARIKPGPKAYFELVRSLALSLASCLKS
jgi:zinc transport system substrate-binding protein